MTLFVEQGAWAVAALLWLVGAPLTALVRVRRRRQPVTTTGAVELERAVDARGRRRRRWAVVARGAALAFVLLALARPHYGRRVERAQWEGTDLLIALDTSASMIAEDASPNRFDRARQLIRDLVGRLRPRRVGLIAFARRAIVLSPLTTDLDLVETHLALLRPEQLQPPGTALAAPLRAALDGTAGGSLGTRVLVLVTDGEDRAGDWGDVLGDLGSLVVCGLRVGTDEGAALPSESPFHMPWRSDGSGWPIHSQAQSDVLIAFARRSGGVVGIDRPGADAVGHVARHIEELDRNRRRAAFRQWALIDRTDAVVLLALAALGIELALAGGRRALPGASVGHLGLAALALVVLTGLDTPPGPEPRGGPAIAERWKDRWAELQRDLAEGQESPALHLDLGLILLHSDHPAAALPHLEAARRDAELRRTADYARALALIATDRRDEALRLLRRLLYDDPRDEAVRQLLEGLLFLEPGPEGEGPPIPPPSSGPSSQPGPAPEPPPFADALQSAIGRREAEVMRRFQSAVSASTDRKAPAIDW